MNSKTLQKIKKHYGWDFCGHNIIRRFCQECKYDVPALWRKDDAIYYEKHIQQNIPLDRVA